MLHKLANPPEQSPFMPVAVLVLALVPVLLFSFNMVTLMIPFGAPLPLLSICHVIIERKPVTPVLVTMLVLGLVAVLLLLFSFNMVMLMMPLGAPLPLLSICHVIVERKPVTPVVKPGPPSRNLPINATSLLMITKFKINILLTGYNHIITVETRLHHPVPVTASVTMTKQE